MTRGGLSGLLALLLLCAASVTARAEVDPRVAEARMLVRDFMTSLKSELQRAIEAGGPAHAIEVCKTEAPRIAAAAEASTRWDVGRTSHRLRNPANAPDRWERKVLESFLARAERGEDLKTMEHYEVVDTAAGPVFRYMKAIPTQGLCLTCHGSDLAPAVEARLAELYPNDRATGFAEGDLRGAFTLVKPLRNP